MSINRQAADRAFMAGRRNLIINGGFDVWQRGTSLSGAGSTTFLADRWRMGSSGITYSVSRQAFTPGQVDVPGEPFYFYRVSPDSLGSAASHYAQLSHKIESVRSAAGQNVVLSFSAKADAAKNIAVEFAQEFGSGGSPSGAVSGIGVSTVDLTSSWQKFKLPIAIPSLSGKTLGTNDDDALRLNFWLTAGSNWDARTNSLGHQTITFDIANVQLEAGEVATPFERRPIGEELALCQRYYQHAVISMQGGNGASSSFEATTVAFHQPMRATPALAEFSPPNSQSNVDLTTYPVFIEAGEGHLRYRPRISGVAWHVTNHTISADAEL